MEDLGYSLGGHGGLKDYMIQKLFDALGVAKYLETNECSRQTYPFQNATNGWTTGKTF